jgi:hypothetical protein
VARVPVKRAAELTSLRDWSLEIIRFMLASDPTAPVLTQAQDAISGAFDRGDLRGLRIVTRDVSEWARGLALSDRSRLDELLRSRFGKPLSSSSRRDLRKVNAILARGRIRDSDEYRLMEARADEIHTDVSQVKKLARINRLLAAFKGPQDD